MKRLAIAFACGLVFALGLGLAGMTRPDKILAFLDLTGARGPWDPSLLVVMAAAVGVYAVAWRLTLARRAAWSGAAFARPAGSPIDRQLVVGAAIFGVGWGLSGFCPGPAVVSLAGRSLATVVFVAGMAAGMLALRLGRSR